jgi:hypothetical protein
VRLTLRTLLSYLDDTLEPTETKEIGQKVAESDAAQELITRIKQVTRRRRLSSPPLSGPGARFDPNIVAAYLDNTLSADGVAEIEKTCLDSDVHLAEIAACHQILTLVLGEPALVPPTAKERMYALVHGRENVRRRAPAARVRRTDEIPQEARPEEDEALLLGLPLYRRQPTWLRWLLPVAALILLAGVGVAIWQAMAGLSQKEKERTRPGQPVAQRDDGRRDEGAANVGRRPEEPKTEGARPAPSPENPEKTDSAKPPDVENPPKRPDEGAKPVDANPVVWADEPKPDRVREGTFVPAPAKGVPWLLVQRPSTVAGKEPWQGWERVQPNSPVYASDSLVALPGYRGEIRTEKGVGIYVWGNVPHIFLTHVPLFESAVTLHKSDEYDVDLSLERGRILLTNHKQSGPATVRVRFYDEGPKGRKGIYNITLQDPDTVVGLERLGHYTPDIPIGSEIGPQADLFLMVLHGKAGVRVDEFRTWNDMEATGAALLEWNNIGRGAFRPLSVGPQAKNFWDKSPPKNQNADLMLAAMDQLEKRLTARAALEVVLLENLNHSAPVDRILGVLCLGAIDDLPRLIDALGDEQESHGDVRDFATLTLRQWIGRRPGNEAKLSQVLGQQKKYKKPEADAIMQLLHGFPESARQSQATLELLVQYLRSPKAAIRQLAFLQLYGLVPEGRKINYNPAADSARREAGYRAWKELAVDNKLPRVPEAPSGPGGATPPK